jgi:hypothetical protein
MLKYGKTSDPVVERMESFEADIHGEMHFEDSND